MSRTARHNQSRSDSQFSSRINRLEDQIEDIVAVQSRTESQLSSVIKAVDSLTIAFKEHSKETVTQINALTTRQSTTNWSLLLPILAMIAGVVIWVIASRVDPLNAITTQNSKLIEQAMLELREHVKGQAYRNGVLDTRLAYMEKSQSP